MKHRVVITGLGVTTALGKDKDTFWNNLMQVNPELPRLRDLMLAPIRHALRVRCMILTQRTIWSAKEARKLDRFVQFAVAATAEALKDSKLNVSEDTDPERVGVIIGSGIGGLGTFEDQHSILLEKGPKRVSPFFIPMMIANMASGQVSIIHGAKGPNVAPVTACASGSHAIGDAFKYIQSGEADVMITGERGSNDSSNRTGRLLLDACDVDT